MIAAEVICDSISEQGHRLTTMKGRCPKFIWQEFLTHRMFSRNASSTRAVPTVKYIEEVRSDALRAAPIWWGRNQRGMQAEEELVGLALDDARTTWNLAAQSAANFAESLVAIGAHKQIVNRILEPFCHINFVVTATEWDNFFGLRLHKDAQPEMRALAVAMWEARKASMPKLLAPGEWHLPFIDWHVDAVSTNIPKFDPTWTWDQHDRAALEAMIKVSVARCARVSYESFETGKRSTVEEDLKLYDRLVGAQPLHASPAEHQGTPDRHKGFWQCIDGNNGETTGVQGWQNQNQWGNFVGWRQYRKMLPGEAVAPLPEEF